MSLLDALGVSPAEPKKEKTPKARNTKAGKAKPDPSEEPAAKQPVPEPGRKASAKKAKKPVAGAVAEAVTEPLEEDGSDSALGSANLSLDQFLCFALYSANHAMHGVYKGLLKEVGLTYPQYLAMTVLWENNNVPVGAITAKLQLDTNTLTPLLKRLEAMDLVTRTRSTKDERQVILKLTRKGRALQAKTAHFAGCILAATGLRPNEIRDLQKAVVGLRDRLRVAGTE